MASTLHVYFGAHGITGSPRLRRLEPADCLAALAEGFDDALEMPTYPAFLGLFYALAGVTLVSVSSFADALQLAFPLASGFALVGPFVALGFYEMSRRRERGSEPDWRDAFAVAWSPALPSILGLGLLLFVVFAAWIGAAELLYVHLYGPDPPAAAVPFLRDVLTTGRGWLLILDGGSIGFFFAALALCLSVISFPLMLDRDVGLVPAIGSSLRLSRERPAAVALWGLIVATGLVLGALTLFVGLAVVMPVLGHSTWRLYRRAVERAAQIEPPVGQRQAGDRPRQNLGPLSKTIRNAGDQATNSWRSRFR
jgi:uncharacterized membrane protein